MEGILIKKIEDSWGAAIALQTVKLIPQPPALFHRHTPSFQLFKSCSHIPLPRWSAILRIIFQELLITALSAKQRVVVGLTELY